MDNAFLCTRFGCKSLYLACALLQRSNLGFHPHGNGPANRLVMPPMKRITVLLADDQALFRKELGKVLKAEADIEVVGGC